MIKMGCDAVCPFIPAKYVEDWGLEDPNGKGDEVFNEVIDRIENNIKLLAEKIKISTL